MQTILWSGHGIRDDLQAIVVDPRGYSNSLAAAASLYNPATPNQPIRLWKETTNNWNIDAYVNLNNPVGMVTNGPNNALLDAWWDEFFSEYARLGGSPSHIILDNEGNGIRVWTIPFNDRPAFFTTLTQNKIFISEYVPPSSWDFIESNGNFTLHPTGQIYWDSFSFTWMKKGLRSLIYNPASKYFNNFKISDWQDYPKNIGLMESNIWPYPVGSINNICSINFYIDVTGEVNRDILTQKSINDINLLAANNIETIPWIAPPSYGASGPDVFATGSTLEDRNRFKSIIRSLKDNNMNTLILWNPGPPFDPNHINSLNESLSLIDEA